MATARAWCDLAITHAHRSSAVAEEEEQLSYMAAANNHYNALFVGLLVYCLFDIEKSVKCRYYDHD